MRKPGLPTLKSELSFVQIEVPDEITVTYSLPAYSASDIAGEYSSLLARLLGTIDSKKYECTIPITGKGKR